EVAVGIDTIDLSAEAFCLAALRVKIQSVVEDDKVLRIRSVTIRTAGVVDDVGNFDNAAVGFDFPRLVTGGAVRSPEIHLAVEKRESVWRASSIGGRADLDHRNVAV